ncbi:MAG TPA: uroporphyrinogen decarboxylase family protein [Spirochaetia bacterium]|nr:uroporphyrinogen decarboxylase family protein [Spirochaetia bacterium]
MTHRDRVLAALNHEAPDRCPLQASFTPEFAARLRSTLGVGAAASDAARGHNPHGGGNTYELERAIGEDVLLTSVGWANSYYANDAYNPGADSYVDEWGISWKSCPYTTRFGTGFYTEITGHPLADDAAISSYRAPDPLRPELYTEAERVIRELKGEYWITGVTVTTIFETAWALRGFEQLLTDFVTDIDRAEAVLDIPYRYHLAAAERLARLGVDMIWIGDDVGAQHSMQISPALWRCFLKPRMAAFIAAVKTISPGLTVAYHSDGCIYPIIPDLLEIGLDVLNPVQPASMDPRKLKKEYGDRLCFWGSIDEQHTLPFGTPEDVRAEVAERVSTLGSDGGLIIGPTHHVQLDTPMENFLAMVEAVTGTAGGTAR